jgi:hypothetical protein
MSVAVGKNTMRNRKPNNWGGSMVEFTMLIPIWLPLLIGTQWLGSSMVRGQQTIQMARDLASMYSRGVNFSTVGSTASNATLNQITQQLGALTANGTGRVIFSTITWVGNALCPAHNCTNYHHFVFTQQYTQGNTGLVTSNFGTPTGTTDASLNLTDYVTNANDQSSFNLITPVPAETGSDGYQAGQPIYVVEVYFQSTGLAGIRPIPGCG